MSVVVDGATSASFLVFGGVPQGSALSSIHFLLIINGLRASASDVHAFAEYSTLHKPSRASLPLMLVLNLVLLCLQLLTQVCRVFPSGEPII